MATTTLLQQAQERGCNAADCYGDEFGTDPADDGPERVGDWDSSAWSISWHDLIDEGATDDDYAACLDAWRAGFWGATQYPGNTAD